MTYNELSRNHQVFVNSLNSQTKQALLEGLSSSDKKAQKAALEWLWIHASCTDTENQDPDSDSDFEEVWITD